MIVLESSRYFLRLFLMYYENGRSRTTLTDAIGHVLLLLPLIYCDVGAILYLCVHVTDILQLTKAAYVTSAMTLSLCQYFIFAFQKATVESLLNQLQSIVDGRSQLPSYAVYQNVEQRTTNFTGKFFAILLGIIMFSNSLPFILLGISYWCGTFTRDMLFLPLVAM